MEVNYLHELAGNSIFTVKFIKKDGEERVMTCRFGVKKYLKTPLENFKEPTHKGNYFVVFDTKKKNYRNINKQTIQWIKCKGTKWVREGDRLILKTPDKVEVLGK